ncbi:MAG: hypothetical protein HKN76_10100 [Saprospiraceae bacterium]|nr:hypothetical protein [Saprospiraceae bacterium]
MSSSANKQKLLQTDGLVAFWDFSRAVDEGWFSQGSAGSCPLYLKRIGDTTTYSAFSWPYHDLESEIKFDESGPLGKAIRFNRGYIYGEVPRKYFDRMPLDIHGHQPFTMIAWVKFFGHRHLVAGIWDEGGWSKYAGRRQYALFAGLFNQDGVIGHISTTGAASYPQSEIAGSQYARIRAIDPMPFLDNEWIAMAMSYDPNEQLVRAYLNGKATEYRLTDPVAQDVFNYQEIQKANPLDFPGPIYSPRAMILKFNGYNIEDDFVCEHQLYVDLDKQLLNYRRHDVGNIQDSFRIIFDVHRMGVTILPAPLTFIAVPGHSVSFGTVATVQASDILIVSLHKLQSGQWTQVGSTINRTVQEGAPFTMGRALGLASEEIEHGSQLYIDGVAIFDRVLSEEELMTLSFVQESISSE